MEVKGTAAVILPAFIKATFGEQRYNEWLQALSPQAKAVYSTAVLSSSWYPLKEIISEPTKMICDMFYNGKLTGAYECGKYSADHALKGIYRMFVKLGSPRFIIERGAVILPTYYRPSTIQTIKKDDGGAIMRIVEFPEIDVYVEQRIVGWMEGALTVCGCKNLQVRVTASLTQKQPYTEIDASWS